MKKATLLLLFLPVCYLSHAQKNKGKKKNEPVKTEYISVGDDTPVPDTATKFIGVIKYRITSDDPADRDSMFIIYGENQIRVTMFTPGIRPDEVIENTTIANFSDSTAFVVEPRNKTYKVEKLSDRNKETVISLSNHKKTAPILKFTCQEYSGEMITKDGEKFEAACLVSKQHSYIRAMDYNFLNIQPVVLGYKIVLGYRTKTSENENTYIIAYEIIPGKVDSYFDLSGYQLK